MVRMKLLTALASAEIAASSFWDKLSDKQKKAYLKAHPGSKYGKAPRVKTPQKGVDMTNMVRKANPNVQKEIFKQMKMAPNKKGSLLSPSVHTGPSGKETMQSLKRHFGGRKPAYYDDNEMAIPAKHADALHQHLLDSGWKAEADPRVSDELIGGKGESLFHYKHKNGGHLSMRRGTDEDTGKRYANIEMH